MIKIIEDKHGHARWFVNEEGISENVYMGATSVEIASYLLTKHDKTRLEALLSILKSKKRQVERVPSDIIRPMNLTEYFMLNELMKITKSQYNKKNKQISPNNEMIKLITDPSTNIQWIAQEKGIEVEKVYHGAITVKDLENMCQHLEQDNLKMFLKKMAYLQGNTEALKRDKITNLDFGNYALLNRALMQSNFKFNKKTNKLIEL